MDSRVYVGQVDVQNRVALNKAVVELLALLGDRDLAFRVDDRTECGDVVSGSHEAVVVLHWQRAAADGSDAVLNLALIGDNAAAAHDADAVRSGVPGADDNVLGAVHLAHQLAEDEGAAVVRQDMDDLAVLEQRDQLTEDLLVRERYGRDDNDARALDRLGHVVGREADKRLALALIAEEAELMAGQRDTSLFDVQEIALCKIRLVPDAHFLACQRAVRRHRLADSAAAQNSDRHVLQITHVHNRFLL